MFDDYVLYVVETIHAEERANDLLRAIKGQHRLGNYTKIPPVPVPFEQCKQIGSEWNQLTVRLFANKYKKP